ncbi:MAG: hypothetical protein LUG26_05695 [Ruminococcus sp.]|nr:hypothetical protein [Ruminococcus sp.]
MKCFAKKAAAALMGGLFLMNAAGCSDENEYSDAADEVVSLAQEDMDYGATITQLKTSLNEDVKISIEYDNRFITEDEAIKLADYVAALNDCDGDLLSATFYPPSLESIYQQTGAADIDEYITSVHDNIKDNYIGYEFEFDYICVEDCITDDSDDAEETFSSVDDALDELTDDPVSDKITSRKLVTFDLQYNIVGEDGEYMLSTSTGTESTLYIYTIDGEIYIL